MKNQIKNRLIVLGTIILCLATSTSFAQNFRITVQSDQQQPVSYASISINGRAAAITDANGVGSIPLSRLSLGDTIAVTYIGTIKETAIFNETMRRNRSCVLTLKELYVDLEPVTIQVNVEDIFLKYTKFRWVTPARYPSLVVQGNFKYTLGSDASFEQPLVAEGIFSAKNGVDDRKANGSPFAKSDYFRFPADILTISDTTIVPTLLRDINYALFKSNTWLQALQYKSIRDNLNTRYGFLGIHDGCRLFRLSLVSLDGYTAQFLLFVDTETKNIRRMEIRTLSAPDERFEQAENPVENVDFVVECEESKGPRKNSATSTFTYNIKVKIEVSRGDMRFSEIELNDMTIRFRDQSPLLDNR